MLCKHSNGEQARPANLEINYRFLVDSLSMPTVSIYNLWLSTYLCFRTLYQLVTCSLSTVMASDLACKVMFLDDRLSKLTASFYSSALVVLANPLPTSHMLFVHSNGERANPANLKPTMDTYTVKDKVCIAHQILSISWCASTLMCYVHLIGIACAMIQL